LLVLPRGVAGSGRGALGIAGKDEPGVGNGVSGRIVPIRRAVEVDEVAAGFGERTLIVPAQSEIESEIAAHLVVVLDVGADLFGAVVAIARAIIEGRAGRVEVAEKELGKVGKCE
jgi:hypothetical protein